MPNSKEQLKQVCEDTVKIKTVLLGIPNTTEKGLAGDIKDIKEYLTIVDKKYNKLSQKFYILVSFLAGSGVLGIGVWGIFNGG